MKNKYDYLLNSMNGKPLNRNKLMKNALFRVNHSNSLQFFNHSIWYVHRITESVALFEICVILSRVLAMLTKRKFRVKQ